MLKEMTFDITLLLKTLNDDRYQVKLLVWKMKQQNMKKKKNYLNIKVSIFSHTVINTIFTAHQYMLMVTILDTHVWLR